MVKAKKKRKEQKNRGGNPHPSLESFIASSKALKGNAFWQQRSKHGRDTIFESPSLMLEAACEYFKWCDENPIMSAENKIVSNGGNNGSSVELHEEPLRRVYSLQGLCRFLNANTAYFRQFKLSQTYKSVEDFSTVVATLEDIIFAQQYEGATVGQFNASIIARTLGLVDKQDVTSGGEKLTAPEFKVYNNAPPLAGDEKEVEKKKK
jgi:hypothetical protein